MQKQMFKTIVIGLGSKARHGKDTAAEHILSTFGDKYKIKCYAFGDNLKSEFYDAAMDPDHPYWLVAPEGNGYETIDHPIGLALSKADKVTWCNEHKTSVAKHLQLYGTEYRRKQWPFYWTDALEAEIRKDNVDIALVKDVRFPNEAILVSSMGGYTVRCTRKGYSDPMRDPLHESETALDGWPWHYQIVAEEGRVDQMLDGAEEVFNLILKASIPVSEAA